MEEVSSEATGLQAPCLETGVGFCCKTLASKLGQCPSFQAIRRQTLERSPPILPVHSRSPERLLAPNSSSHCHSQAHCSSYSRLLNSYTHFNTQLKCDSLQKGLPASYLPICSHRTECRRTGLRTGLGEGRILFSPGEKGMGEGGTG